MSRAETLGWSIPISAAATTWVRRASPRRFVARSAEPMAEWMGSDLSPLDLVVIQIDGLHVGGAGAKQAADGGALTASHVLLATNAYTDDLWPGLKRTMFPLQSLQIATAPLAEDARRSILPEGHVVSDTRRLLLYFRLDGRGHLIVGGRGTAGERIVARHVAYVERAMRRLFPQAAGAAREYVWAGHVAVTVEQLPHLHELALGLMAALGYSGRGVAMATLLGKLAAERLLKGAAADTPFPLTPMRPLPLHALRLPVLAAAMQYYRLRDTLDILLR
ncbi:MAG: FAD-binding oxidoreductase [Alphaproteobacteria bacterium]|nr:FAD-binding oxidoreductase [Alphaproteobacteria bacterium]